MRPRTGTGKRLPTSAREEKPETSAGPGRVHRLGRIVATNAPEFASLDTVDAVLDQLDGILAKGPPEDAGK